MRTDIPFSSGWKFIDAPLDPRWLLQNDLPFPLVQDGDWQSVDLPHSIQELPLNHFDEKVYQKTATYFREFAGPALEDGEKALLEFEGVAVACKVWLNGAEAGSHTGPYTPFSCDITRLIRQGKPNHLFVEVSAEENPGVPPFGGVVDYLVYGGIYRAVNLRIRPSDRIMSVFADAKVEFLGASAAGSRLSRPSVLARLKIEVQIERGRAGRPLTLFAMLKKNGNFIAQAVSQIEDPGQTSISLAFPEISPVILWDIGHPELYDLEVSLIRDGESIDSSWQRIGFRKAEFTPEGFFLNGKRLFLRGLNRHQSWPYAGYAMGPGPQREDARILKEEFGATIVRTSHYPQSPHFLDECDRLGLLVFAELPGWQHVGQGDWKEHALADLETMIIRDRNHPSIILWGVRINESQDDHDFYTRTNALAKKLDPSRQTGGVRYIKQSELLEDVYTFNDFTHDRGSAVIAPPRKVLGKAWPAPYLISEHNGHMYPTKRWDQEERLAEHARRHARVLNAAMRDPSISGAIGWCAFDYNTHKDFGSGDRICYHGVADMFRIPKYAAALYASQLPPSEKLVLEPASIFAKGERSAARMLPVEVYTNCDAVDLYRGETYIGRFYPDTASYPALEHPPVLIDDLIGQQIEQEPFSAQDKKIFLKLAGKAMAYGPSGLSLGDKIAFAAFLIKNHRTFSDVEALVIKYGLSWGKAEDSITLAGILDGKEVIRKTFGSDAHAVRLELIPDSTVITLRRGDEWNAVRVVARITDQYGNRCPYAFDPIQIRVTGAGRLLGPSMVSLQGGAIAFWVAAGGSIPAGMIGVEAVSERFGTAAVQLAAEERDA